MRKTGPRAGRSCPSSGLRHLDVARADVNQSSSVSPNRSIRASPFRLIRATLRATSKTGCVRLESPEEQWHREMQQEGPNRPITTARGTRISALRVHGRSIWDAVQRAALFSLHLQHGPVAQWSEQGTHNPLVAGSIPAGPTGPPAHRPSRTSEWTLFTRLCRAYHLRKSGLNDLGLGFGRPIGLELVATGPFWKDLLRRLWRFD